MFQSVTSQVQRASLLPLPPQPGALSLFRVTAQVQTGSFLLPSSECVRESLGDVGDQRNRPFWKSLVVGNGERQCGKGYTALSLCHLTARAPPAAVTLSLSGKASESLGAKPESTLPALPGYPHGWWAPQSYARCTDREHRRRLQEGRPPPAQPADHAREDSPLAPTSHGVT